MRRGADQVGRARRTGTYNILAYFDVGVLYPSGSGFTGASSYGFFSNIAVTGDTTYNIDIPFAKLSGQTTDANGVVIPNVKFSVEQGGVTCGIGTCYLTYTKTLPSDANGNYGLFLIPSNSVKVSTYPTEPSDFASTVFDAIPIVADTQKNLVLSKSIRLSGVIRTTSGVPLKNASLGIYPCASWGSCATQQLTSITSKPNGEFSVPVSAVLQTLHMIYCEEL